MSEGESAERGQAPTPRRREEASRLGHFARSRDLTVALSLLAALLVLEQAGPAAFTRLRAGFESLLAEACHPALDTDRMTGLASAMAGTLAAAALPLAAATCAAAAAGCIFQGGLRLRPDLAAPLASRLNPLAGARRLLGVDALSRGLFGPVKLALALWLFASPARAALETGIEATRSGRPAEAAWEAFSIRAAGIGPRVALGLVGLAAVDYAIALWRHERSLRMTRAEAREEMLRIEGNPEWRKERRRFGSKALVGHGGRSHPVEEL